MKQFAVTIALSIALAAPALAGQQPVWEVPADQITVVSIDTTHPMPVAIVRDGGMRGHNVYCITEGAHIGKATVARIDAAGVTLSNGRILPSLTAYSAPVRP